MMKIIMFLLFVNFAQAIEADFTSLYQNPQITKEILTEKPDEPYLGAKDAPVTIIEYSSLSCFHCAEFHKDIFPKLKEQFIDKGILKYVHRDFPLNIQAIKGAALVHCADKSQFFLFLKLLFDKQSSWAFQKNYLEILENIGKLGGIPQEKIKYCLNNKEFENNMLSNSLEANKIVLKNGKVAIAGTPTFFINGERFADVNNIDSFSQKINNYIK